MKWLTVGGQCNEDEGNDIGIIDISGIILMMMTYYYDLLKWPEWYSDQYWYYWWR